MRSLLRLIAVVAIDGAYCHRAHVQERQVAARYAVKRKRASTVRFA
jgi:hypothetical protein